MTSVKGPNYPPPPGAGKVTGPGGVRYGAAPPNPIPPYDTSRRASGGRRRGREPPPVVSVTTEPRETSVLVPLFVLIIGGIVSYFVLPAFFGLSSCCFGTGIIILAVVVMLVYLQLAYDFPREVSVNYAGVTVARQHLFSSDTVEYSRTWKQFTRVGIRGGAVTGRMVVELESMEDKYKLSSGDYGRKNMEKVVRAVRAHAKEQGVLLEDGQG